MYNSHCTTSCSCAFAQADKPLRSLVDTLFWRCIHLMLDENVRFVPGRLQESLSEVELELRYN